VNLDWTRIPATETGTTRYVARTAETDYVIVGRDVLVAAARGGAVTVRRFQAYEAVTRAAVGAERDRLTDAKREVAEYLDDLDDADVTRTPLSAESADEEDLARSAARVAPAGADLDPTSAVPVTVEQAMTVMLHVARKLDTTTGSERALADLAHLTEVLSQAVGTRAQVLSSYVVARQHAETAARRDPDDQMNVIAAASAETVEANKEHAAAAFARLAGAIVAYDPRW
jgi:hypothetical protein